MSYQSRHRINFADLFASAGNRPSLRGRIAFALAVWRQRVATRRCLASMDARSLRDVGISPEAAAYESGKPFWKKMGDLR